MSGILWSLTARVLALPPVANWLINQAMKTPYFHLTSRDGEELYMGRWWLLNPYDRQTNVPRWAPWFPWSIRIHHIVREDRDCDPHDHPWNARTFILRGWYREERVVGMDDTVLRWYDPKSMQHRAERRRRPRNVNYLRTPGHTASLRFGEYHRISEVAPEGAMTLFISGPYQGAWGFLVQGVKVHWKKYLGIPEDGDIVQASIPENES